MLDWLRGSGSASHEYQPVRSTADARSGGIEYTTLHVDNRGVLAHARELAAADADMDFEEESPTAPGPLESAKAASKAALKHVKDILGFSDPVPDSDRSYADELDDLFSLSRTQRLYGFLFCFVLGWLLSLLSLVAVSQIAVHPEKFALLYTFGNVVSLCSTACLWGPCSQLRDMFKPVRVVATCLYLASMVLTLVCAFQLRMMIPTLCALLLQMFAMAWYCLTYIPFGQDLLARCLAGCCSCLL